MKSTSQEMRRELWLDSLNLVRRAVRRLRGTRPQASPIDGRQATLAMIIEQTSAALSARGVETRFEVIENESISYRWDAIYRRIPGGYRLELPSYSRLQTAEKAGFLGPTYLYWLTRCQEDVEKMVVTLSDGDQPTLAQFSPSTNQPHVTPVPDPFFFMNDGYRGFANLAEQHDVAWPDRTADVVWRGSSSGIGTFDPVLGAACPSRATQRLLLCLAARGLEGVDVALSSYRRDEFLPEILTKRGLLREEIREDSWIGRKFAIDVDGQTNTWSNLLVRLHLGCCVLKVDSREGYHQWYYPRLRPWEHFIPVRADLSDFAEQIEWARSHDGEAEQIARNGRDLAKTLSLEAVTAEAAELITKRWREASYA